MWNDLIVQLNQCLHKCLESIIVIRTSIYRKLFSHIGHHCMSQKVIHHAYLVNFGRSPILPVDVMLGHFDRERNDDTIPQYITKVRKTLRMPML